MLYKRHKQALEEPRGGATGQNIEKRPPFLCKAGRCQGAVIAVTVASCGHKTFLQSLIALSYSQIHLQFVRIHFAFTQGHRGVTGEVAQNSPSSSSLLLTENICFQQFEKPSWGELANLRGEVLFLSSQLFLDCTWRHVCFPLLILCHGLCLFMLLRRWGHELPASGLCDPVIVAIFSWVQFPFGELFNESKYIWTQSQSQNKSASTPLMWLCHS